MSFQIELKKKLHHFCLDIKFEIKNEIVVLFGPSGAGKSITLNALAGLCSVDDGNVFFNNICFMRGGKQIVPPQKRHLGYIFQSHNLFPHLNVEENILFGAKNQTREESRKKLSNYIEKFNLHGLEKKRISEISGGQSQRIALARTLISAPQALLLDEPFSALDTPTRVSIGECLSGVFQELNIPILFVTHDIYEACAMATKMIILHEGKILQIGSPQEVYENPQSSIVKKLVRLDRHLVFRK